MRRIALLVSWNRAAVWSILAVGRLAAALRRHWKRVLLGAFVGWVVAVVGGAVALAALEVLGVVSRETSDALGIVIVFGGMGLGALISYALKPTTPGATPQRGHPAA
jgi:hypothetical protein